MFDHPIPGRCYFLLALVFAASIVLTHAALAETTAAVPVVSASTTVDFAGVLNFCISIFFIVLTFGGPIALWVMNKTKASAATKAFVENIFSLGANLVAVKLGQVHIATAPVDVKSQVLAEGLTYAIDSASQSLTKLGYDPTTDAGREHIISAIEARVPAAQAASGVTAAPALAAAVATLEPIAAQAIADPHSITTGQLVQAVTTVAADLPADAKAKALAAAETVLPPSLAGVLTSLAPAGAAAAGA